MRGSRLAVLFPLAASCALAGCASTQPDAAFRESQKMVETRTGQHILWDQAQEDTAAVDKLVHALLEKDLSQDAAVTISLLENRRLRATFESLGVAQADLVQAGLIANPQVGVAIGIPVIGDVRTGAQISIAEEFLSIFTIAARKRIAEAALAAAEARVGADVIDMAHDVEVAYYTLLSASQVLAMQKAMRDAAEAGLSLRTRQHDAGNASELDLASEQALYEQTIADVLRADAEVVTAREALARLLGLGASMPAFHAPERLPELPAKEPELIAVTQHALERRLDYAAAQKDVRVAEEALDMAQTFRWVGASSVGATFDHSPEGYTTVGPGANLELPLFDQKQAVVARHLAYARAARARADALEVDVRSEVRAATLHVAIARKLVESYRDRIVPSKQRVVLLSQERHNAMLLGAYQLLAVKQQEIVAYKDFILASRDYWIARAEASRACGGTTP